MPAPLSISPSPYHVLVLAPFSPELKTDRPPLLHTDTFSLNAALAELAPSLNIPVNTALCPDGLLSIRITRMGDFKPAACIRQTTFLSDLAAARDFIAGGGSPSSLATAFPAVARVITISAPHGRPSQQTTNDVLDDLLSMVDNGATPSNATADNNSVIRQIDSLIGRLLQAVFSDHNFRRMEAAWRGAELLCRQIPSGTNTSVHLHLMPLPEGNCLPLFDLLETALADNPPDLALIDMPLANTPRDMTVLERIMAFGETMLTPVAIPLTPQFLGIPDWSRLHSVQFIPSLLEGAGYARWKTLARSSAAGWAIPCVNGITARPLHQPEAGYEWTGGSETTALFIHAAFALGALCLQSVARYGRPTRFADKDSVRLDNLALVHAAMPGLPPSPLEVILGTDRLREITQAHLLPLAGTAGKDHAFAAGAVAMDGGSIRLRLFLSQLTGFLIRLAATGRDEVGNATADLAAILTDAIGQFIQTLGLPIPNDLRVTVQDAQDGSVPLSIALTPAAEILSGGQPIQFGFRW